MLCAASCGTCPGKSILKYSVMAVMYNIQIRLGRGGGGCYGFFLKKYSDSQCCCKKYSDFGGGKKKSDSDSLS